VQIGIRVMPRARGIYNFVTSADCQRQAVQDFVDASGDRLSITWKYPSVYPEEMTRWRILFSALTNNRQQADTGTKMVHIGKNTRSTIVSKGISAGRGQNSYRGL